MNTFFRLVDALKGADTFYHETLPCYNIFLNTWIKATFLDRRDWRNLFSAVMLAGSLSGAFGFYFVSCKSGEFLSPLRF